LNNQIEGVKAENIKSQESQSSERKQLNKEIETLREQISSINYDLSIQREENEELIL